MPIKTQQNYEKEIKELKIKFEKEKEIEKRKFTEAEDLHRKEERLLTTTLYELGSKIAELTMEKRKQRPILGKITGRHKTQICELANIIQ